MAERAVEAHERGARARRCAGAAHVQHRRIPAPARRFSRRTDRARAVPREIAAARRLEGRSLQRRVRRHVQRAAQAARAPVRLASARVLHEMIAFSKAHAYGNDFLYVRADGVEGRPHDALARALCERHTGVGADGLIIYKRTADGASMRLFNADGSRSEVSGNGVRGLAALLLRDDDTREERPIAIHSEGGVKRLVRTGRDGSRQTFRAAMGLPEDLRQVTVTAAGESVLLAVMNFGNPQAVVL